jgi:hypothetical protein
VRHQLGTWSPHPIEDLPSWLEDPIPAAFLVDDAERLTDADGSLAALIRGRHPDAVVVLALRADALRTGGGWLADLRPAELGIALDPDAVRDPVAWACPLPQAGRRPRPPGRGVLVDHGGAEVVQLARAEG